MEQGIIDFLKDAGPAWGAIVAVIYLGLRQFDKTATQTNKTIIEITKQFQESVKEIGEKCHKAHHEVSMISHEQVSKMQEAAIGYTNQIAQLNVQISFLGEAVRELRDRR